MCASIKSKKGHRKEKNLIKRKGMKNQAKRLRMKEKIVRAAIWTCRDGSVRYKNGYQSNLRSAHLINSLPPNERKTIRSRKKGREIKRNKTSNASRGEVRSPRKKK